MTAPDRIWANVKPLVWEDFNTGGLVGKGYFDAVFCIGRRENGFHVSTNAGVGATLKTLDRAKAFYEDQYREFVMQALSPSPEVLELVTAARAMDRHFIPFSDDEFRAVYALDAALAAFEGVK